MLRYIDLFAGIGGFHQALNLFGETECVFASEIDSEARSVYSRNFGITPFGDITKVKVEDIPPFDLLCAGFPCQPFSKGGNQNGFNDVRGTLFFDIVRIIDYHKPKYVLLENVQNIVKHDNGNTYKKITKTLKKLGYYLPDDVIVLSPHNLGIPVHRPRAFIPCSREKWDYSSLVEKPVKFEYTSNYIGEYFNFSSQKNKELKISDYEFRVLNMWNEFYKGIDVKVIGFPIWYRYFKRKRVSSLLPEWKRVFIKKNILLYQRNKEFIDSWEKKHDYLNWVTETHKKFEWNCGLDCQSVFDGLIQFRPSGVRVKRLNYFSALVAMNHPQIVGPLGRRLDADETKLLQSFPSDFIVHPNRNIALKQLGNAVNVEVVRYILNKLIYV